MAVITFLNRKGGVGKTTMTANIGANLARRGSRILLVDNDPQASLTKGFLGPNEALSLHPSRTIAAIYAGESTRADQAILPTGFAGVDLLAGSNLADSHNFPDPWSQPWGQQSCLAEAFGELSGRYDHILVDCAPNIYLCSWAALVAADHVLIPVQPEDYGSQGLAEVMESVDAVRGGANPRLELLGLIVTMFFARRSVHQLYRATLAEQFPGKVFADPVPHSAEVSEANMMKSPLAFYKPKGAGAKLIARIADELLARLAAAGSAEEAA